MFLDPKDPAAALQPMDFHRPHSLLNFVEILPQTKLNAHQQRYFEREQLTHTDDVITHIRMKIFPDGGISRLRVWGEVQL